MTQALYINDRETYQLYTELIEDLKRTPMEYWEVDDNFFVFDKGVGYESPRFWWMTPYRFHEHWKIVKKQTKTTFAEVEPR